MPRFAPPSLLAAAALTLATSGCATRSAPEPVPVPPPYAPTAHPAWLPPNEPARSAMLERQFRGFDMAMVETGRRYVELYWAVQDRNWAYADYQAEKIGTAIGRGLDRRPARAPSARIFLDGPLAAMQAAVKTEDAAAIARAMTELTAGCNSCHSAERVPFMGVRPPVERTGPIGR